MAEMFLLAALRPSYSDILFGGVQSSTVHCSVPIGPLMHFANTVGIIYASKVKPTKYYVISLWPTGCVRALSTTALLLRIHWVYSVN